MSQGKDTIQKPSSDRGRVLHGWALAGRQPQDIRRIYNVMGLITAGPVQDPFVGPADYWVDELTRLVVEVGMDTFIYWPAADPLHQIELFATGIVPAVQKQVARARGRA